MTSGGPTKEQIDALRVEAKRYLDGIGPFILAFADCEFEVYELLKHYGSLTDDVGRALLSGTKITQMREFTLAVAHNMDLPIDRLDDLKFVFAQIATIQTVRDRVVHFGSTGLLVWDQPEGRILTNLNKASRYGGHFVQPVGSKALADMARDLRLICAHLVHHRESDHDPFTPYQETPGSPTTWLYKSERPAVPRDKSLEGSPKQQRRQKPSRQSRRKEK